MSPSPEVARRHEAFPSVPVAWISVAGRANGKKMFFFGKKKSAHHIVVLPHPELCPSGEVVPAVVGKSIAEALVASGVELSHSCQFQCSCTTCHVFVMEGGAHLSPKGAEEAKVLAGTESDDRWSRLACQSVFQGGGDLVVEIRNA